MKVFNIKKNFIKLLISLIAIILSIASFNYAVDPYFHYHKPLSLLEYPIEYQRYQNNGILRNFEYDSIILGTSMTENFKTSELDDLFEVSSVKIPSSGARPKENNDDLISAFKYKQDIKMVVRGIDLSMLIVNKDERRYDDDWYPDYLYDDLLLNDVKYLLNKGTLWSSISCVLYTLMGYKTTTFDEYSNWMGEAMFGIDAIDYKRPDAINETLEYSSEDYTIETGNILQNFVEIAKDNKDTQFYYFFSPYSILYFDSANRTGTLVKILQTEKVAIEELIKYDNIHLYSFFDYSDIICNLDNYKDIIHYGEDINSYILDCMSENKHSITKDNYVEYCEREYDFLMNYDYDSLFSN